jgi:hypothetical protein
MLKFILMVTGVLANSGGHIAFRSSKGFIEENKNFILSTILREVEDLQLSDVTIKHKSDYSRLSSHMTSVKASFFDFEAAAFKIDFIVPEPESAEANTKCSDNGAIVRMTISNFQIEFQFTH